MKKTALRKILALGALTGMRSMAGPTALAMQRGGMMKRILPLMATAEMVADKAPQVGNRTDPVPLAGRALAGAVVGAVIAHDSRGNMLFGAMLGAAAAIAAAHLAFQARTRLPMSSVAGGLLEDAVVVALGSRAAL